MPVPVMSRTKPERKVMALVATIVARALMTLNSPVRLLMPTAPVMRSPAATHQPGDEQPVDELHALALEREPLLPGEFEPAAFRIHHAGEIEAARRPALVAALLVAAEMHAHRLEVLEAGMRVDQRLPHQLLVGDAVIAGDDLVQDAVDVVARQRDDGPGVGERGVAGAADQPGVHQRHARAGRAVALGRQRGHQAARAAADHQHVGVDQNAVEPVSCRMRSPRPRTVLHRRMHVDDVLRDRRFRS